MKRNASVVLCAITLLMVCSSCSERFRTLDDATSYFRAYSFVSADGHQINFAAPCLFEDWAPRVRFVTEGELFSKHAAFFYGQDVMTNDDVRITVDSHAGTVSLSNGGKYYQRGQNEPLHEIIRIHKSLIMQCTEFGQLRRLVVDRKTLDKYDEISSKLSARYATDHSIGYGPLHSYQSYNAYQDELLKPLLKDMGLDDDEARETCTSMHVTREDAEREQDEYREYVRDAVKKARNAYLDKHPNDRRFDRL